MRSILSTIWLAVGLAACSQPTPPAADAAPPATSPAPFTIELSFSEAAAAKLTELGEGVMVSAFYFGDPKTGVETGEDPFLALGSEEKEVAPATQSVKLAGAWDQSRVPDLNGFPRVNVTVFSARKSGPDNLLDCGLIEGDIAAITDGSHPVHCKLIGE